MFDKSDFLTLKIAYMFATILAIISTVLASLIKWWQYTWFLSIFLGLLAGTINYIKIVIVTTNATSSKYKNAKLAFVINNITALVIYFIVLLISALVNFLNIFLCFIGIMLIKIVIIIRFTKKPKQEEV